MSRPSKFSPEVRERAIRMVAESRGEHGSQWGAIRSVSEKLGCTAETLRRWIRQAEVDQGKRAQRVAGNASNAAFAATLARLPMQLPMIKTALRAAGRI